MPSFNYLYANSEFHTKGRWLQAGNADLESEKTVAYEIGVNHMLGANTAIDLTFFYKDITDMTETVTVGPTVESNPQARANYSFYLNSGYGNVRGFEINLKRPWSGNWRYHAAYTFMVAKGFSSDTNEGYLRRFDDEEFPTQQFYLDWDRRHTFLVTAGYAKPKNWSTDISIRYATGAPYTHPLQLSKKPSRNQARFPSINSLDWEVHKWFDILGVDWDVFVRMTNLFNQQNLINWDDTDQDLRNWLVQNPGDYLGPFGDYTIYGPARNFVWGLRVNF
jgi:outer membrane receptor for ferrienterochelin and colicin